MLRLLLIGGALIVALLVVKAIVVPAPQQTTDDARWTERLRQAVVGTDHRCPEVVRTFHSGMDRTSRTHLWSLECDDQDQRSTYMVTVARDGSMRVMPCSLMKATTQLDCFVPLDR